MTYTTLNQERIKVSELEGRLAKMANYEALLKYNEDADKKLYEVKAKTEGESCAASIVAINKTEEQLYGILEDAVVNNDLKLVRALHTFKGIDFEHKVDDYGNVVLFTSVSWHDFTTDMTELLLQLGANVNATNNQGWTALHIAAQNGDSDTLELLVEAGADVTAKNKDNN